MNISKKIFATSIIPLLLLPNIASSVTAIYANEPIPITRASNGRYSFVGLDGETSVEVVDNVTIKLTYSDGMTDLLEKREDGVYKNGQFLFQIVG